MNRPEDILETGKYIEWTYFENDQESILFHSYLEWQNYARELEKKLEGQSEQFFAFTDDYFKKDQEIAEALRPEFEYWLKNKGK